LKDSNERLMNLKIFQKNNAVLPLEREAYHSQNGRYGKHGIVRGSNHVTLG